MTSRPREARGFFWRNLLRWGLAEAVCQVGNLLPTGLARRLWRVSLQLNGHHEVAALNLATSLAAGNSEDAWDAFIRCARQLENPHEISASDLALSRWSGRMSRRLSARRLWGPLGDAHPLEAVHDGHDAVLQLGLAQLARHHFKVALADDDVAKAARALAIWHGLEDSGIEERWAALELAWKDPTFVPEADDNLLDLLRRGAFHSPLDCLRWGERCLDRGSLGAAKICFQHARELLPEEAATWRGSARCLLAEADDGADGDLNRRLANRYLRRALCRHPQDVPSFLMLLPGNSAPAKPGSGRLSLHAAATLALGEDGDLVAQLDDVDDPTRHTLHVLPPVGWGITSQPRQRAFEADGSARVRLTARRPHRLRGQPWQVLAIAVGPQGHHRAQVEIEVDDPAPGQILLTVTEDHEIHEERGVMGPELLQRVLVDKSRAAADLGVPWTHMVEVGSVLSMPLRAADRGETWRRLWVAVRRHLIEEVVRGHDLQPHLHTFNDPAYTHFPYSLGDDGWRPSMSFLLTEAQRRGDFATVCPPPGHPPQAGAGFNRLQSVERAVGQLEQVGRLGHPDYRPLLWRSGLLEYGDDEADRAWSAVALRRAGLLADSDVIQPLASGKVPTAYASGWTDPGVADPEGPLFQLPILGNLEGGYLQGRRRLQRQAKSCLDATRRRSGVHLFTLLTHDKFINARRGRDEFQLDPTYGDWPLIRDHLSTWSGGGAEIVTAAEGLRRVLDDSSLHLQGIWRRETFVAATADPSKGSPRVRYRIEWLGRGIEVGPDVPLQVWLSIPCSWRGRVEHVEVRQGQRVLEVMDGDTRGFWIELTSTVEPVECQLTVDAHDVGPRIDGIDSTGDGTWTVRLSSAQPFAAARLYIPWHGSLTPRQSLHLQSTVPAAEGGAPPRCEVDPGGFLLTGLSFAEGPLGAIEPLELFLAEAP